MKKEVKKRMKIENRKINKVNRSKDTMQRKDNVKNRKMHT
jgi:hypothetical protein